MFRADYLGPALRHIHDRGTHAVELTLQPTILIYMLPHSSFVCVTMDFSFAVFGDAHIEGVVGVFCGKVFFKLIQISEPGLTAISGVFLVFFFASFSRAVKMISAMVAVQKINFPVQVTALCVCVGS